MQIPHSLVNLSYSSDIRVYSHYNIFKADIIKMDSDAPKGRWHMLYFPRIRDLREDNDKTQREISEYLYCDQSLYSKYERGQRIVPVEIIIKLAQYYGTSTDYILGLTDSRLPKP